MSYFVDGNTGELDLSKVRDRGSKKWVAMMLPEHVKFIRQYNEETKKIPRPKLDEWDLEAIQQLVELAVKRNVDIEAKIWKDGAFVHRVGKITWVGLSKRTIEMEDTFRSFILSLDEIVDINILE